MRLAVYGGISTLLATSVVTTALRQRSNFYAACIYLSKSSACMMVLMNMGIFITILVGQLLQAMFFGPLRAIEVEHLYERSWYAVTETCLAMTIFRDEFDARFVVTFTTLLFLKIFHWLCADRVEFMEQTPQIPRLFHARIVTLLVILGVLDCALTHQAVNITVKRGANVMIMFGFEYAILASTVFSTFGKYILNIIDAHTEEPWETKSIYVFYLDLISDFFKLVTYLIFFTIILHFYGLPLHIIRDVYVTFRSFLQKCTDLYRYQRATRNMNERYPDVSEAELTAMSDRTCIICREEMFGRDAEANGNSDAPQGQDARARAHGPPERAADIPKRLPCGHVFHFHCLRSWLERQQTCPTCRAPVLQDSSANASTRAPANPPVTPAPNGNAPNGDAAPEQQANGQAPFGVPPAGIPPAMPPIPNLFNQTGQGFPNFAMFPPPPPIPFLSPTQQPQMQVPPAQNDQIPGQAISSQQQPHASSPSETSASGAADKASDKHANASSLSSPPPGAIPLMQLPSMFPPFPYLSTPPPPSSTIPPNLTSDISDEDIRKLSATTREAMVERLRILQQVQNQIVESMSLLSRVVSVLPEQQAVNEDHGNSELNGAMDKGKGKGKEKENGNISGM
ncbi:hypothetical protein BZG36_01239 [Bifiguratus adelaidae]|uniref:RING-type E3 ubiquitin transferase n=1 Tax=Bifiguratus adelaidae TaxID=1938954 RepID=A0A261Y5V6_9FUNG|nr:hypothetical protein BZG36_01239 [Bifiguratus adelaidae]